MISGASDGAAQALFCHNYARIFSTRSADDGATWSEPIDITRARFDVEWI